MPSSDDRSEIIAAEAPLAAESFYITAESQQVYARSDIEGVVDEVPFVILRSPAQEFEATWKDEEGGERTQYWRREPNGDIVMTAAVDHGEDALALFEPPLVLMPAQLSPDTPFEHSTQIRVMRASRPESERTRGTCTRTMRYVGDEMIAISDWRRVRAKRLEITFRSSLTLATTEKLTRSWIEPVLGLIAEERSELTKALGLFGQPEFMRLELADQADRRSTIDD